MDPQRIGKAQQQLFEPGRSSREKYADLVDTVRYGNCGNADFLNAIYLWKTPEANCHDDRGDVCMDYSVWQQKWTEIRGA